MYQMLGMYPILAKFPDKPVLIQGKNSPRNIFAKVNMFQVFSRRKKKLVIVCRKAKAKNVELKDLRIESTAY